MKTRALTLGLIFAACVVFAGGNKEAAEVGPQTVTIGYNRFLESSFGPAPAPLEVIEREVSRAHPEIAVELNILPDTVSGMRDAIAVWMVAGDGTVDIYGMDTPWVSEFGRAEWAVDLNEEIPGLRDRFLETGLDIFSYEGKTIGIPFWGSISGLYYRTDLMSDYGVTAPRTYDELWDTSKRILSDRPEATAFAWPGAQEEALVMVFADFLYGFGGQYRDASGAYAFGSPEAVEALTYMVALIREGISPPETTAWNGEEARRRFVEGEGLFLWHNSDLVTWLDDPERSAIAGNWDFTTTPAQPEGRAVGVTGGFAFAINPHTDTMEATRKVMTVISSEPVQEGFALAWGPVQYYKGLYEKQNVLEANANADKITNVLENALSRPPSFQYSQLSDILQQEIHSALTGRKSPEEALGEVTRRLSRLD